MAEKNMKTRIVHKHDTEANWIKAVNFIPMKGEIIIYDIDDTYDYERFKIGDGTTPVIDLPFAYDNVTDLINSLVGDKSVSEQIHDSISTRKEKDLIITYAGNSVYNVTHSVAEINEAVNNGRTVKFQKDAELLDLLEVTADFATFYIVYVNMNNKLQQKIVAISGNSIILEQDDTYDFASKADLTNNLKNYFTKTETQNAIAAAIEAIEMPTVEQSDWAENDSAKTAYIKNRTHWVEDDGETYHPLDEKFLPETVASKEYVEALYKKLNSNTVLGFYCVEDVTIIINGMSKTYPANSNVEVSFIEDDVFEIVPTSNNSILSLTSFPGALNTFYPWLEGVKQFSNILFDMNPEEMYTKWNQGNQGSYQVQYAQYVNCIFWSDNPYISELSKRTNYTLYYSSQLPLCYSTIPDNTFKAFYLAFGVNSDPNWGNIAYRESFAKATYATQVFSYYGARTIGIFGHDDPDFNIMLPKDCRGLMSAATAIENAGTFDAINVTNFGAKSGSWRDAFGWCGSLRNLYIKNLKVNLNVSWSPLEYDSIYFIISTAANTNAITITVSPYTYNLLGPSDFELATSKNITIELLTTNYIEDRRLKAVGEKIENGASLANTDDISTALNEAKLYTDEMVGNIEVSGGNGQPDWAENDSESANYIKNRTHWIELSYKNAFPVQTINVRNNNIDLMDVPLYEHFTPGATCKVTINDSTYEVEARRGVYNAYEWYVLGNGSLIGEDGGEDVPFGIFIDKYNENYAQFTGVNGDITFGIELIGETIHKIPEYYLPDSIGSSGTGTYAEIFNNLEENIASGDYSHAENFKTTASSYATHAEGMNTIASGYGAHAEGNATQATAPYSHAEGWSTITKGSASHAEGLGTIAISEAQTVVGKYNAEASNYYFIVGNGSSDTARRNAFTVNTLGEGEFAGDIIAGGLGGASPVSLKDVANSTNNILSSALFKTEQILTSDEQAQVRANLRFAGIDVEGKEFVVDGVTKIASPNTTVLGDYDNNVAIGQWASSVGCETKAIGRASFAEGVMGQAIADGTHVEGYGTKATGYWSHAEGEYSIVSSYASHAEGSYCTMPDGTKRYSTAAGYASHTEGGGCHTTGTASHAEGIATTAAGTCAHSEGRYTIARGNYQHVEGLANIEDTENKYIHIAGNGTSPTVLSNAYTLDWSGNGWFAGGLKIGGTSQDDADAVGVATTKYVDDALVAMTLDEIDVICGVTL